MRLLKSVILPVVLSACSVCAYPSVILDLLSSASPASSSSAAYPVVIWHGLGDNFQNDGLKQTAAQITAELGVSVYLIHFGDDGSADQRATLFGRAWDQVDDAAAQIQSQPDLRGGYHAIGFSQGGQLLRALVQTYPDPPVHNLITVGSQHLGVSQLPACGPRDFLCKATEYILRSGLWTSYAQGQIIPAQYFRAQADIAPYLINSGFLREINNERWGDVQVGGSENYLNETKDGQEGDQSPRNKTMKENLLKLDNFVMLTFSDDKLVTPITSSAFTLLNYTTDPPTPIPHARLPLYKEDYIGLRALTERGSVHYGTCKGEHMQIDDDCWELVMDWLRPSKKKALPFVMQLGSQ